MEKCIGKPFIVAVQLILAESVLATEAEYERRAKARLRPLRRFHLPRLEHKCITDVGWFLSRALCFPDQPGTVGLDRFLNTVNEFLLQHKFTPGGIVIRKVIRKG
jgi:hypothetical protein